MPEPINDEFPQEFGVQHVGVATTMRGLSSLPPQDIAMYFRDRKKAVDSGLAGFHSASSPSALGDFPIWQMRLPTIFLSFILAGEGSLEVPGKGHPPATGHPEAQPKIQTDTLRPDTLPPVARFDIKC
jgi:hypothetical protein